MNIQTIRRQHGFSLIEMLVVIIILGVLAAFAMPMYQDYIEKGQLADAKTAALKLRQEFEAARLARPRAFSSRDQFQAEYDNAKAAAITGKVKTQYRFSETILPAGQKARPNGFSIAITPTKSSNKYGLRMTMGGDVLRCDYKNNTLAEESSCSKF